jgi:chemotaxis protein CheX
MNPINPDDVVSFTRDIWNLVLGQSVEVVERSLPDGDEPITGCVQITGVWRGAVIIILPPTVARKATAVMYAVPPEEVVPDQINDAIGELANMLGGNLKSLLPTPCFLSLPVVIHGNDIEMNLLSSRRIQDVQFETADGVFEVAVLKHAAEERASIFPARTLGAPVPCGV